MVFLKWICIGAVGLYLIVLLFVYITQRSFMYFPPTDAAAPAVFKARGEQIIPIEVDGIGVINAIYAPPPTRGAPVILFMHGNGSAAHQYLEYFDDFRSWGAGFLAVEYPGYAANPGTPNEADNLKAAQAHYDYLLATGNKSSQIIIFGHSLGAAVAVDVAKNNEAAGLVLAAPFLSMLDMGRKQMPYVPNTLLMKDKYRSDLKIPLIGEPLLLLHGDRDELIPHSQGRALYELHEGDKNFILIKGGYHQFWGTDMPAHIREFVALHTGAD